MCAFLPSHPTEPTFQFNYSNRAIQSIAKGLQSQDLKVNTRDDGTFTLSLPVAPENKVVAFKTQAKGTQEILRAKQTGYETAAQEYKSSLEKMNKTVSMYQSAIQQQVQHANEYQPELPAVTEAKVADLRARLEKLQQNAPDVSRYGTSCADIRNEVMKCYQNNPTTPLKCTEVVNAFSTCVQNFKN